MTMLIILFNNDFEVDKLIFSSDFIDELYLWLFLACKIFEYVKSDVINYYNNTLYWYPIFMIRTIYGSKQLLFSTYQSIHYLFFFLTNMLGKYWE